MELEDSRYSISALSRETQPWLAGQRGSPGEHRVNGGLFGHGVAEGLFHVVKLGAVAGDPRRLECVAQEVLDAGRANLLPLAVLGLHQVGVVTLAAGPAVVAPLVLDRSGAGPAIEAGGRPGSRAPAVPGARAQDGRDSALWDHP